MGSRGARITWSCPTSSAVFAPSIRANATSRRGSPITCPVWKPGMPPKKSIATTALVRAEPMRRAIRGEADAGLAQARAHRAAVAVGRRRGDDVRVVEPVGIGRVREHTGVHRAEQLHGQARRRFDFRLRELGDLRLEHVERPATQAHPPRRRQGVDLRAQLTDLGAKRRKLAREVGGGILSERRPRRADQRREHEGCGERAAETSETHHVLKRALQFFEMTSSFSTRTRR